MVELEKVKPTVQPRVVEVQSETLVQPKQHPMPRQLMQRQVPDPRVMTVKPVQPVPVQL
jgi:hypothetical protein